MGVHFKENEEKITLWMIIFGIILVAVLLITLISYILNIYSKPTEDMSISKTENVIVENKDEDNEEEFEDVSIEIGKKVNEEQNNILNDALNNESNQENQIETSENTNKTIKDNSNIEEKKENIAKKDELKEEDTQKNVETKKEVKFIVPVEGTIIKEFAPDSLIYSNTLQEWITHNGVDIKADKTSVVVSACDGVVSAIKNDPRYGLTVIIDHEDGFKTLYANLLTAEYIVVGENVKSGQTIGTIGNSANFEIADEYHLHFEIIKDGEYDNPKNYISFE